MYRAATSAVIEAVDAATRRVTVRLVRYNDARPVADADGVVYREAFAPGSLVPAARVAVYDQHHGELIGRADLDTWADTPDGPTVELVLARTAPAADMLALIEADAIDSVSIEHEPVDQITDGETVTRTRAVVHGVAFTFRPAHDAPILATRTQPETETPTMTEHAADDTTAEDVRTAEAVTPELLDRSLAEVRDELHRAVLASGSTSTAEAVNPLSRYRSLGEYAADRANAEAPAPAVLTRALADQITTNNPGVMPPGWVSEVAGIITRARPSINAFGVGSLPPNGMDINWPYFDGDLSTLVGEQATEKTSITSVRVDLKKGTAPVKTYAGGSDLAYQLIRRSDPSYLDAYLRIMASAMAVATDQAAVDGIEAAMTSAVATWDPATGDLQGFITALVQTSIEVEAATGAPAEFALASTAVFGTVAGLAGLVPPQYGTQNAGGVSNARTLSVEVSGVPIIHDPNLSPTSLVVSNGSAGQWWEDGPYTITAEDVENLGRDVAVFSMGAFGALVPAGIKAIAPA